MAKQQPIKLEVIATDPVEDFALVMWLILPLIVHSYSDNFVYNICVGLNSQLSSLFTHIRITLYIIFV